MDLNTYIKMTQLVADHIVKEGSLPEQILINGDLVSKSEYLDMMSRFQKFKKEEGRSPLTIQTTQPGQVKTMINKLNCYKLHIQKTPVTCGPSSLIMGAKCYGMEAEESEIAKISGTGSNGTSHQGLMKAVEYLNKKFNKNLRLREQVFSKLEFKGVWDKYLSKGVPVLVHYSTKPLNNWTKWKGGHYSVIKGVSESQVEILCPTKGDILYPQKVFAQAMGLISQPSLLILEKK